MKIPKKNEIYTLAIDSVSSDGNGVGKINGFAVFVPQTAPGDTVSALIVKAEKNYAYAKAIKILSPSPARQRVPCAYFPLCGGCTLMHIKYEEQTEIKKNIINNALLRIAKTEHRVDEMIPAETPYRYRNKMVFPVGTGENGDAVCGFYRPRSHDLVPLSDCLLGGEFNSAVISAVLEYMKKANVGTYDEKTHTGTIRRVFTRVGAVSGEIMTVISANAARLPQEKLLVELISEATGGEANVILNINKSRNNLVLGEKNIVLFGKGGISDILCGEKYEISPHSFYQINHAQTEKLYQKALEYATPTDSDTVLDVYCGIGTISLCAARLAKRVIGVEIVPSAIADAKRNAESNGVENAEFYCSDAAELVPKLLSDGEHPDVVILDPPRKGSDKNTLSAIAAAAPKRIVYVSCNPSTLARDIAFLERNGFFIKRVCGVDMFPNTSHVETVCLLSRVDK